jgi:N-acetyl-1-D-myo-inositol-2-amino-2-deoxy-alpha-D-glucopyranoside deacetylase
LLFVHPHPDDESIACGGTIARYGNEGAQVHVVTCTGGEAGDNLSGIDLAGRDFTEVRRGELEAAVKILGVTSHRFLGYRDSGMAGMPANEHPEAFVLVDLDEAAVRLAATIRELRPDVVVSDDEKGTYGHPDHVRAHEVTRRAVALAADAAAAVPGEPWGVPRYVVITYSRERLFRMHQSLLEAGLASPFGDDTVASPDDLAFGSPEERVAFRVDVQPWLDVKQEAMAAHASQIAADSFFLNTPPEQAPLGFGTEEFELVSGRPAPDQPSDDLLAGLR